MNWDSKFASIVRETEQSLARVKTQLKSPLSTRRANGVSSTSSIKSTPLYKASSRQLPVQTSRTSHGERRGATFTPAPLNTDNGILKASKTNFKPWANDRDVRKGGIKRRSVSFDLGSPAHHTEGGSTVMSLLSARLRDQNKEIASLTESVSKLEGNIDNQNRQIKTLQSELNQLQRRMSGTYGDISETKLQQFKREVNKELEELRSKLAGVRVRNNSTVTDNSVHSIAHELHASKRLLRGDIESLQEDVSSLKSKYLSQETEMSSTACSFREIERRLDKNDKVLSQLQEWQRNEEHAKTKYSSDNDFSSQLQRLRQLMCDIQSRLSLLEQRSFMGRNDSTLLQQDLAPPTSLDGCGLTFNPSSSSSSTPFSKSSSSRRSLSQQTGQPSFQSSASVISPPSYRRPGDSLFSRSSLRRPVSTSSRTNPLFTGTHSHSFRGQSSRDKLELHDDDTLDDVSVLSLESDRAELNQSLDMLSDDLSNELPSDFDLSPPSSLLTIGAL